MAPNRANLQKLADICNEWFEALDIALNPVKSVHLSFDPATNQPTVGSPIELGMGDRRAPVLRLQPLKEPMRILGMYSSQHSSWYTPPRCIEFPLALQSQHRMPRGAHHQIGKS